MNDTTITITIPGEWNERLRHVITHWPEMLKTHEDDNLVEQDVKALALAAWHEAQQPRHVLEVGDEVLVYNDGGAARKNDKVTAIGEISALVRREGNEVRVHWTEVTRDKALVRTKDGREVTPIWPST